MRVLLDEHMPPKLALVFEALGHEAVHVVDAGFRSEGDADLIRNLSERGYDYLATLDQYRQPEVWPEVYTLIAEGSGRLLRLSPSRARGVPGTGVVARLSRYLVDAYDGWSHYLANERIALIDLGRRRDRRGRSPTKYSVFTRREVAGLLQQQLGSGGAPRMQGRTAPRRGRS